MKQFGLPNTSGICFCLEEASSYKFKGKSGDGIRFESIEYEPLMSCKIAQEDRIGTNSLSIWEQEFKCLNVCIFR